ncbi:membrane peptidoglycan carboxypeptidase [Nocardioides massiliensis]|uniref:Membrane peptidoglycan carboxypeptidase n=2 Tax=Nocardioides massiliensis TaxID=1325935 RepID=A0ABT9NLN3_9ACTN|nr:transglycosylase domain-containing protein [Nocardioides massiliensis]MDP9821338.1 membrane peptidoglycan carboxypeptidase [Nocardioides massiliensis]
MSDHGKRSAPRGGRRAATSTPAKAGKNNAPATKRNGKPKKERSRRARIVRGLLLTLLGLFVLGAGAFAYVYAAVEIPDPNEDFEAQTTFVYYADGKTEIGRFAVQNRVSIPLSRVPEHMQDAMIAAEDRTFWSNQGLDPRGIVRAAFSNATSDSTQGASTITQQYVKVLYLTQDRTWSRKIKEAFLSLKVHRQKDKSEILEGYLNTIYFGRGAYGVQAAAKAYFGVDAADLNLRQSAALASIVNQPNRLDPANGDTARDRLERRYRYVLDGMVELEQVSQSDADEAAERLPKFPRQKASNRFAGQKGHMMRFVRQQLVRQGFTEEQIDTQGLRVTTTFTRDAMRAAREAVRDNKPEGLPELHVAVASVEPSTGALRGMYGGQDFLRSEINWAAAGGQPGSTFKVFALMEGLRQGFSLRDTFDGNSGYTVPGAERPINNQGTRSYGRVDLIRATADSINTAFIDLTMAMDDGPQSIVKLAESFGLPKGSIDDNIGVALGSSIASPISMANAYGIVANGGVGGRWHVIERVENRRGDVEYSAPKRNKRVLDTDLAADTSYALQQVVTAGSGRNAQLAGGRATAGKTGTATNAKGEVSSSWFIGYTPQLSTAVMYVRGKGNEQLEGYMPEFFGGSYPARTFKAAMDAWHEDKPFEDFPPPVFVDGDPPSDGHAPVPVAPAPAPAQPEETEETEPTKKPRPSRTPTPTREPTPTQEPTPTDEPTTGPTDNCGGPLRPCEPDPEPTGEPTGEPTDGSTAGRPPGQGSGGTGGRRTPSGRGRRAA